ncbi:unnamed protein product [Mytilus coruscus]|uniref:Uncharacterized protein n=1 Tax=Mytilus coruscus TaxID=42192 RepID=A0A6J8AA77_MYTCO|nr:unnamed protein product [Mytilus coruscus]
MLWVPSTLRRNLRHCPKDCRKQAYIGLIGSLLEYASIVWDPYLIKDINALERAQRQALRIISGDYTSREEDSIRRLMNELKLQTLENRRRHSKLTFLYKVVGELVPAIPQDTVLVNERPKRQIKSKQFSDYKTTNIVDRFVQNNSKCFKIPPS